MNNYIPRFISYSICNCEDIIDLIESNLFIDIAIYDIQMTKFIHYKAFDFYRLKKDIPQYIIYLTADNIVLRNRKTINIQCENHIKSFNVFGKSLILAGETREEYITYMLAYECE